MNEIGVTRSGPRPVRSQEASPGCAIEKAAYARLVREHAASVLRYAWSLVADDSRAEEVCIEVFRRAAHQGGPPAGVRTLQWLLALTQESALSPKEAPALPNSSAAG